MISARDLKKQPRETEEARFSRETKYEATQPKERNYGFIILLAVALIGGLGLYLAYSSQGVEGVYSAILIGSLCFLPVGALLGFVIFNKEMLCSVLRKVSARNWGIINLVAQDGRNICSFMKDLNNSIIERQDGIWIIRKDRIFLDKGSVKYKLDPDKIRFKSGVPVIFLDFNTLEPLDFWEEKTKTQPKELAPLLKGWLATEELKGMMKAKTIQIGVIILIFMLAVNVYLTYDTWSMVKKGVLPAIQGTQQQVQNIASQPTPNAPATTQPAPNG